MNARRAAAALLQISVGAAELAAALTEGEVVAPKRKMRRPARRRLPAVEVTDIDEAAARAVAKRRGMLMDRK